MDIPSSLKFFKKLHIKQKYADGSPYWVHLFRVGNLLKYYLELYEECNQKVINEIIVAGYGHDSLEDTNISIKTLEKKFGTKISKLIWGMTNEQDDDHTNAYVQKICTANEEIRLIKLADMCDNYLSMIYRTHESGKIFLKKKIIPIMEPMYRKIIKTKFDKYKKTGNNFLSLVQQYHTMVINHLNTF